MRLTLIAIGVAALYPLAAFAQPVTELQPVEVRGAQDNPGFAAMQVISRAEIERAQATDLSELLRRVAGVEITRLGGPGQQTSVFVRGANSNSTVIAIDGVRINSAFGGAAIQNLRPSMIERIEVTKGARSTQWGPDAVGGVINVVTKRQGNDAGVQLRAGSRDTRDGALYLRRSAGEGHLGMVLDYLETDGLPPFAGSDAPSGYRNFSGLLQAGSKLDTVNVDASYLITRGRAQYQDNGFTFDPRAADYRSEVAIVSASEQVSDQWHSRISASYTQDDLRQIEAPDRTRSTIRALEWANTVSEGAQTVTFTARGAREDLDTQFSFADFDQRRYFWSVGLEDELRIDNQRVTVGVAYLDDKAYGSAVTWSAEYGVDVNPDWTLFALAGTAVRAPDPFERLPPFGNPDIDAEKARNIEAGAVRRLGARASLDMRVFRSDIRDQIVAGGNVGRGRNEGLEASWLWAPGRWDLRLNAVWQDPRNARTGERLARRAKRTATGEAVRRFGSRYQVGVEVFASGDRPDIDAVNFTPTTTAGYAVVNLTAGARITPTLMLRGRIENIGDIDYQTVSGYNQPDRGYFVSIDYRWRQ